MFKEINSSEIISYLANIEEEEEVTISIKRIRELGHKLENTYPYVSFDGDKYTIESFKQHCKSMITVTRTEIKINKSNEVVHNVIARYQPSPLIVELLQKIINN